MRQFIKRVSRIVTAQAGQCCSCKFPLEDEYGKYQGYKSHDNWEVWSQEHDAWGWQYFLKCLFCKYELARQYWKDLDGTFVDYTDGLADERDDKATCENCDQEVDLDSDSGYCNDCTYVCHSDDCGYIKPDDVFLDPSGTYCAKHFIDAFENVSDEELGHDAESVKADIETARQIIQANE